MRDFIHQDLFYEDSIDKQLIMEFEDGSKIDNTMLHYENFTLTESINSSQDLKFGSCEASSVQFRVSNIIDSIKNKWFDVNLYLDSDMDNGFKFGEFKVNSDKPTADRSYRDIIAYDRMYDVLNANVTDWYNGLKFPMTIKAMRNSFFNHLGITQQTIELPNDNFSIIKKGLTSKKIMGSTIITSICEINGCFGHIDYNGVFTYKYLDIIQNGLYPRDTLFPREDLYPSEINGKYINKKSYLTAQYEDYYVSSIDKVQILNEENSIVGSYGSGTNSYIVSNNFLTYGATTSNQLDSVAKAMYERINGLVYRPVTTQAIGNPCYEIGDIYFLNTTSEILESYILQRTLKGIQALKDSYISSGNENREDKSDIINELRSSISTTNSNLATTNSNLATTNSNLAGTTARVSSLEADHVSVGSLNAVSARVGTLEADHVSVQSLNAVSAKVNTISANYVTANTVDTKISSAISNFSKAMYCNSLSVGGATFSTYHDIAVFSSSGKYLYTVRALTTDGTV